MRSGPVPPLPKFVLPLSSAPPLICSAPGEPQMALTPDGILHSLPVCRAPWGKELGFVHLWFTELIHL